MDKTQLTRLLNSAPGIRPTAAWLRDSATITADGATAVDKIAGRRISAVGHLETPTDLHNGSA